jgi:hypothetical protein
LTEWGSINASRIHRRQLERAIRFLHQRVVVLFSPLENVVVTLLPEKPALLLLLQLLQGMLFELFHI